MGKNKPFIVGAFLIITLVFMVFMTIRIENKAVDVSGNVPGTESAENETDSQPEALDPTAPAFTEQI